MTTEKATIRALNDALRQSLRTGIITTPDRTLMTPAIDALSDAQKLRVMQMVADFEDFTKANDPHEEHDFGHVTFDNQKIFWKIDYYGRDLTSGSEDPSDPAKTARVLTIMLASEF